MYRIHSSSFRLLNVALFMLAALAASSTASAACVDTNTCFGTHALPASSGGYNAAFGLAALNSNSTGHRNTASGAYALFSNSTGFYNTASGYKTLYANTTGNYNTASGYKALYANTTGKFNTAHGTYALYVNTTGSDNTASGRNALRANTTGINNTAYGSAALANVTTGFRNIAVGWGAGDAVTTGSDNIIIGSQIPGGAAQNGVIRIGSNAFQQRAFIAGIRGKQTGATGAVTVLIDANGQLGTFNSSRRFKEDIQPMGSVSERLFALRPVTFRYKQAYADGSKPVQFGLVAEEVAEVFPELVVYGKDGEPETVSYHLLATLLLNELQKEHRELQEEHRLLAAQATRITALEQQTSALAALQEQVAAMAQVIGRIDKSPVVVAER
jgi:hypothetical protein